ncbi:outer membrane lipoprotein carrier protein LolA [Pelagibius sp.]|uniref:LolA family protein n=1 Tax=Pelagibius sp. TaxID=1931238 RepID=UPI002608C5E6|nr:outer membrane lipoprotein carrier protein LolA [Pelagibius sp.]
MTRRLLARRKLLTAGLKGAFGATAAGLIGTGLIGTGLIGTGLVGSGLVGSGLVGGVPAAQAQGAVQSGALEPLEALSPDQVAALTRVERYLNDINTMQARFVQISDNGGYAQGDLYVDRPGHMRFDYDAPTPVLLIANGLTLLYYDKELKEATFLPLWETPLWFLIREEVRFDDNVEIVGIEEALGTLRVSLRDPDTPDGGVVTLVFSDRPLTLRKWELIDPQGIETQVSLVNPVYGEAIDDDLFKYHDLEVHNRRRPER